MVETLTSDDVALYADFDNRFTRDDARFGIRRRALTDLPVIDFTPFLAGGTSAERQAVAGEIRRACIDVGFFYLENHGISADEFDEVVDWGHRFFALPVEEKMRLHKNLSPVKQGYMGPRGTDPSANPDLAADLREVFGMGRELMEGEPEEGRFFAGATQWPAPGVLPGFEGFMKGHIARRVTLAQQMVRAFALSLGLPETWFDAMHHFLGCNLSYNYYPATDPSEVLARQWGISPHSDYGSFTLLSQDAIGGLEVRNAAGEWFDVPPIDGTFVVNIGDLFAIWTNDLYAPSLHRAKCMSHAARISVPFFVFPHGTTVIECLETCQGPDNPPRYSPRTAEEHVRTLVLNSYRQGRPGVAVETAKRLTRSAG
jgi:isopenicillin N synthase-like dioxygenase